MARDLNNLAGLLTTTNRLAEAEPLMRRALAIDEASYGKDHPNVAIRLNNLAQLLKATNRLAEAEPLMRRALAIDEASYGNDHPRALIRRVDILGKTVTGRMRIYNVVSESKVSKSIDLVDETVTVQRRAVNRAALEDAFKERVFELSEFDERALVSKSAPASGSTSIPDPIPDVQRSALSSSEAPAPPAKASPRAEADRCIDLALLADHYSPGDRVEPDARLPAAAAVAPDRDYTLEVAIRANRLGFGGSQTAIKAPRQLQEPITVYARIIARGDIRFEDTLLPLTWPYDADSTPAFFRFRTGAAVTSGTLVEVRLLSADLRLLDQLELVNEHGQWHVNAVDASIAFARPGGPPARDALALHVTPAGAGYAIDAILTRDGNAPLELLPLGQVMMPADIANLLAAVRNHWTKLVIGTMSNRLALSTPSYQKESKALAEHGHQAWRLLFGDGRGSQAGSSEAFARLLIDNPLPPDSIIRITCDDASRDFTFPWTIVAPPPDDPPAAGPPQFWGLSYQIEVARKQGRPLPPPDALRITAVVDDGFRNFVDHRATLEEVADAGQTVTLSMPSSRTDVSSALSADNPSELFYFFCHGIMGGSASGMPADIVAVIAGAAAELPDGNTRAPWDRLLERLAVTDGAGARIFFGTAELTEQGLRDTDFFKANRRPLVFLNMCHSAATLPASRAGLPAVFLDRDAVAVIGTESPINAEFGDAFARALLTRLLAGEPLGAAMLETRRCFHESRNPLALVYTIYGRGDTILVSSTETRFPDPPSLSIQRIPMTSIADLPQQTIAAAEDLSELDLTALYVLIGSQEKAIDRNPVLAFDARLAPGYDSSHQGIVDELKTIGERVANKWARALFELVCGDKANDPVSTQLFSAVGMSEAAAIAAVTALIMPLVSPPIAAAVSVVIVKKFLIPAGGEICLYWGEQLETPPAG
jgi:hypothetical protein